MAVKQTRCIRDDITSPCVRMSLAIPGIDALIFRASPGEGGELVLNLVLMVSQADDVLTWRPGVSEGAYTQVLASIRAFLRNFESAENEINDTPLQRDGSSHVPTLVMQKPREDIIIGAAVSNEGPGLLPSGNGGSQELVIACGTPGSTQPASGAGSAGLLTTERAAVGSQGSSEPVRVRLAALPTESRRLVQALAVLGGSVSFARLGTLLGSADDVVTFLQPALDAGLVRWQAQNGSAEVHEHLRALVCAEMTPAERHAAHAWAGRWSVGLDRLLHRAAAARAPEPGLADELEKEADALGSDGHADHAALLLRHSADLSPDAMSALQRLLRSVEFRLRHHHTAVAREELGSVSGSHPSARHLLLSGRLSILEGDLRTGMVQLAEAHERIHSEEHDDDIAEASTLWLAQAQWLANAPSEEIKLLLKKAHRSATEDPFWDGLRSWVEIVVTAKEKGPVTALQAMDAAPSPSRRVPTSVRRRNLLTEAWMHLETGELKNCENTVHEALDLRMIAEDSAPDDLAITLLGHLHWLRGNWPLAQLCAGMVTGSATPLWRPMAETLIELIRASRGTAVGSLAEENHQQPIPCQASAAFCRIIAAVESGNARYGETVLRHQQEGLRLLTSPLMPWRALEVIRLSVLTGDEVLLDESLQSIRRLQHNPRTGWMSMFASWGEAIAAAHAGRRAAALDHYNDAETYAASSRIDAPWYQARLQADHAELLASVGKRRASLDRYRVAQETASRLGAQPLLDRCIQGLSRLRLPRPATGYGLTQREAEVARLVASGLTNKEAAAHLYVTPASIAFHLGNIFAKVGVRNRYELRSWWNSLADAKQSGDA